MISRDTNSGTFETFKELVLGKEAKIIGSAEYTGSNGGLRQRLQMTKGAIGYAGLGFVDASVKALEIYIVRLRKKIENSGAKIITLRGLGYVLEKNTTHEPATKP